MPAEHRKPFWLYPNLLSLDAPLIAVVWLYIFAQTWRLGYHPWEAYVTLGLVVWVLHVADRLLNASMLGEAAGRQDRRHHFHRVHQRRFLLGMAIAFGCALLLVVTKMPMTIYKYLLLGAVMVAGFFGLEMLSTRENDETPLAKNVLAGVTFAFGTAMTAHIYRPELGIFDMLRSREFVSFAVLCVLNICAVELWQHASRAVDLEIKASDELALTLPLTLLGAAALVFALLVNEQSTRPFFYAVLTSAALLYILNRRRAEYALDALRVLAAAALLLPFLVFLAAAGE
ncbi:MAG: hypothetical protein WCL29_02895 [Pseudomonadota bacterium]